MDRTMAARAPAGRLGSSSRTKDAGRGTTGPAAALGARARRQIAALRAALSGHRRLRIALLCALVALPLLGAGWLWFRHSSFVAVEHVRVSGAHGPQATAIDSALTEAAKRMSTLDASPARLRAAVARFPDVSAIRVRTSFPHAMAITVVERRAVAALVAGGTHLAIGADGVALGAGVPTASLPQIADDVAPASGDRAANPLVLQALAVLGAAPQRLDRLAARAYFSPRGLTVAMRSGLLVYFGDASRPHAKWLALAAVLADASSTGAVYVDVRTPERAAEGFTPGTAPHESEAAGESEPQAGKSESTVSALAAGLAAATPEGRAHIREEQESRERAAGAKEEAASEPSSGGSSPATEASGGEGAGGGTEAGG
jgi:cell division septal protein FtsQ